MRKLSDCEGKQQYLTRKLATQIIKRNRKPVGVYKCPYCRQYHIGQSLIGKGVPKKKNWVFRAFSKAKEPTT
jgi:hypothetical protein